MGETKTYKAAGSSRLDGTPDFTVADDWVMQALNNVLDSKNKGGNLESKIRNSIVRQIKSIWGKKPKVEILFN